MSNALAWGSRQPGLILDLFAGPGGWSEGLRMLGMTDVGLEWDESACKTRAAAGHTTVRVDVSAFALAPVVGRTWGAIFSPPCTKFSAAGKQFGLKVMGLLAEGIQRMFRGDDCRQELRDQIYPAALAEQEAANAKRKTPWTQDRVEAAARDDAFVTVLILEPARYLHALIAALTSDGIPLEWAAFEQVPGVLPLWKVYAEELRRLGWSVWTGTLNAANYGVPQTRERAVLIASSVRRVSAPDATHDKSPAHDLFGSPPCQPFSVGGKGSGRKALDTVLDLAQMLASRQNIALALKGFADERTGLVLEPLRWALEAKDAGRPYKTVLLEQVSTVLPVWEAFAGILRAEGYSVVTGRLSAEEYGVPQTRVRAFLIAMLDGEARLPQPTHQRYRRGQAGTQTAFDLRPWLSMVDAIGWGMTHRPALTIAVGTAAGGPDPSCVGGSGARATLYGERDAGRWVNCTRIVDADSLPAYRGGRRDTIRVTPHDAALLQTFPGDHPFQGSQTKVYEQIGNAVPCLLAEHVIATVFGIPMSATDEGEVAA